MRTLIPLIFLLIPAFLSGCSTTEKADLIILNAKVVTLEADQPEAEAVAIKDGKILAVGSNGDINKYKDENSQVIEANGRLLIPGWIDGHAHFASLGKMLMNLDLMEAASWETVIFQVSQKAESVPAGSWITGRGWHQEKWATLPPDALDGYPTHNRLSALTPDHPVMLSHASGHALFANAKAMELAGINSQTPDPEGGRIIRDAQGNPTGIFEENAMDLVQAAFSTWETALPEAERTALWKEQIRLASETCLRHGITSLHDAGVSLENAEKYIAMAEEGALRVRLYSMLIDTLSRIRASQDRFPVLNAGGNHFLSIRGLKMYMDGALGSHGAWLLEPYADQPGFSGQNVSPLDSIRLMADWCAENGMQLCIHGIGDRANREILDIYASTFAAHPTLTDPRWRIEHAQHLDPADIPRFASLGVFAAMQAIHCTSDAPFVVKRLGGERAGSGAYAWRRLLDAGAMVGNGTDAPVERIDPIANFYAAVTRKGKDGMVFFPDQKMSRMEAIKAYTLHNAYAAFEDSLKGSIKPGKLADLVLLSRDILVVPEQEILGTEVDYTILGGKVVYVGGKQK